MTVAGGSARPCPACVAVAVAGSERKRCPVVARHPKGRHTGGSARWYSPTPKLHIAMGSPMKLWASATGAPLLDVVEEEKVVRICI